MYDPPSVALYSPMVIDQICDLLVNGGSLTKICQMPGMPSYTTLSKWRRQHPEVATALEEARRDRAEALRDKAVALVEGDLHKNDVPGVELQVETLWKAAGVDDVRYSPRAKVEATVTVPTQIIVETGIRRDIQPEAQPTHTESAPIGPSLVKAGGLLEAEIIGEQEPLPEPEAF
jgi:transposase-like protein